MHYVPKHYGNTSHTIFDGWLYKEYYSKSWTFVHDTSKDTVWPYPASHWVLSQLLINISTNVLLWNWYIRLSFWGKCSMFVCCVLESELCCAKSVLNDWKLIERLKMILQFCRFGVEFWCLSVSSLEKTVNWIELNWIEIKMKWKDSREERGGRERRIKKRAEGMKADIADERQDTRRQNRWQHVFLHDGAKMNERVN